MSALVLGDLDVPLASARVPGVDVKVDVVAAVAHVHVN